MKISVNWMKQFGGQGLDVPIAVLVDKIGAQLGAVEETIDLGAIYRDVIVTHVITCEAHPNASRLHVCKIDDGGKIKNVERDGNGHIQVVCGAANVRQGLVVAWLPPESTVPSTYGKDQFVLESIEIRGVMSNGMLGSARELAIGDDHEGIFEIGKDAVPGTPFAELYELNDYIIDIENKMFTHRPDCFGQLGVAREIAGISDQKFTSPDWYLNILQDAVKQDGETLPLKIKNELPELVPRFMAVVLTDIDIKPSPIWLQSYLNRVGMRPINNVVDITNYMMMVTGQPLHAYDYDKVREHDKDADHATLTIRYPRAGEKIVLLNGKEIEPRDEAIMIAVGSKLIGVGGVMGGADVEVHSKTQNIILECATFDMYSIRRTAMAHGLFTDSVTRFNKGQSPKQNYRIMAKSVEMLREYASAKVASEVIDVNHADFTRKPVQVPAEFINTRLGLKLSALKMKTLLENVEFEVDDSQGDLMITAPFWRTDIEIPEDIIEEIGRLYGFDHLSLELPRRDLTPTVKDALLELKSRVREILSRSGGNEVLTYSFVHGNLFDKVGQDKDQAFQLSNASSPDLQYYRMSLMPSLLEKVHPNIKASYDEFALFELNKVHNLQYADDDEGLPTECNMLGFVVAKGDKKSARRLSAGYYSARVYLDFLVDQLGLLLDYKQITEEAPYPVVSPYDYKRSAYVSDRGTGIFLGMIGEFKQSVIRNLKLPEHTAGFEIGLKELLQTIGQKQRYVVLPRFPAVTQDICLRVASSLAYSELFDFVLQEIDKVRPKNTHSVLSPVDVYQSEDNQEHKQITLRLQIASYENTMRDVEVNQLLSQVAEAASAKFGAERI